MPTVGWINEAAEKAWESAHPLRLRSFGPDLLSCPFCDFQTPESRGLLDHLALTHAGARPLLLIGSEEPGREEQIFSALAVEEMTIANCTQVVIQINGAPSKFLSPDAAIRLLSQEKESKVDVWLRNKFDPQIRPLEQCYTFHFFVPDSVDLKAVDHAFAAQLASERIDFSDIDRFLSSCPSSRSARRYAEALVDYARGVLIKDRPAHVHVTVPYAEYRVLYQRALSVLDRFPRPLPNLICNSVRFALNDFEAMVDSTGFVPLDSCTLLMKSLIKGTGIEGVGYLSPAGRTRHARCPVDEGVSRVVALAERLTTARQWTAVLEQECRQAAEAETLDATDRHKVLALWAGTAFRLGVASAAQEPLAQLSAVHPFDRWATMERERSNF
jgi:hypothetical protein